MGIYIKDMEMPTRCAECRLSTVHNFKERPLCDVLVEYMSYGEWEVKRLDNCPLVPVPPHGRLIDADVMRTRINCKETSLGTTLVEWVDEQETVIEAEEGE